MWGKKGVLLLLDIVIVILGVIFAAALIFCVQAFREASYNEYGGKYMQSILEWGNYSRLLPAYYAAETGIEKPRRDETEYYAVAEYFEASVYHRMYQEMGEEALAERYAEKMEAAAERMGDFSFIKDNIDKKVLKFSTKYLLE